MKILLDNVESIINVNEYESFQVLLWDIEKTMETRGRVITSLKVDGMNLENILNFSLEEIRILEISSKSPLKLLEETIHELDAYLDRFFIGIEEIVSNFRIGNREEGISNLIEGINGLDWIFQILRKSQELLDIDNENLEKIYIESNDVLLRLTEAVEEKQYDGISIILDFDLYVILSQIKEFVPVIFELLKINVGNDILFN